MFCQGELCDKAPGGGGGSDGSEDRQKMANLSVLISVLRQDGYHVLNNAPDSGNSSFKRTIGRKIETVSESTYLNY